MKRTRWRKSLPLLAILALGIPAQAGWVTESSNQAYVLKGCGSDSGTTLLTIQTGSRRFHVSSESPISRAAFGIGSMSVAKGKPIQIYALDGFPASSYNIVNGSGFCQSVQGIDILGISIDRGAVVKASRAVARDAGIRLRRQGTDLLVSGTTQPCELVDLQGRTVARSVPGGEGSWSIPLAGVERGAFVLRSGGANLRFVNF